MRVLTSLESAEAYETAPTWLHYENSLLWWSLNNHMQLASHHSITIPMVRIGDSSVKLLDEGH